MRTEIVISTYNAPRFLRLALASLPGQQRQPDSVCVADDGSGEETAAVIRAFAAAHSELRVRHAWHPDRGFRKNTILNRAIATSEADHLIFTDGDCLLSPGFVVRHRELVSPRHFACGSLIRLSAAATATVSEDDVVSGRVFSLGWLRAGATFDRTTTWLKAMPLPLPAQKVLDAVYPIRRTWMGSNASALRESILAVNGFDESMAYGGGDKEFGVRLANSGVTGRRLRFTAPVVHLDHTRGYRDAEAIRRQRAMIATARKTGRTWTDEGIVKVPLGDPAAPQEEAGRTPP